MMDAAGSHGAVELLHHAEVSGQRIEALPPESKPATVAEALAIEDHVVALSGRTVAGFKVATDASGAVMYGAIYTDDCYNSPARIDPERYPLLGIEGEIAYRFTADLPVRETPYSRAELEAILFPFPAIEIVDSRYADYRSTPFLDRVADRMSNGGIVLGTPAGTNRSFEDVNVTLTVDGETTLDQRGGHSRKDPLLPAMDFIHAVQQARSFRSGQFITTGTFTGLFFGQPGQRLVVEFRGLGSVELAITKQAES